MQSALSNLINRVRSSRFLKAGAWYAGGHVFSKFISFLMLPVFALLLTPAEYGVASVFLTWTKIFLIVFSLYAYAVPVRAKVEFEADFSEFISSLAALGIFASLLFIVGLFVLPADWHLALFELPKVAVLVAALNVPLVLPLRIMQTVFQANADAQKYTQTLMIQDLTILAFSVGFILLTELTFFDYGGIWGRIAGVLVVRTALGLVFMWRVFKPLVFFRKRYWAFILSYAVPIIPYALSEELLGNFDRIMVAQFIGPAEAGIYSFAYQMGASIALIANSVIFAWLPWFYENMKAANYDAVRRAGRQFTLAFTALTAVAIAASPVIVALVAPSAYRGSVEITPLVMAGSYFIFLQLLFVGVETHALKTGYTSVAALLTAAINLGLNFYFIPRFGTIAAAFTTLASYVILFIVHVIVVRVFLDEEHVNDLRLMLLTSTGILTLTTVVYLLTIHFF